MTFHLAPNLTLPTEAVAPFQGRGKIVGPEQVRKHLPALTTISLLRSKAMADNQPIHAHAAQQVNASPADVELRKRNAEKAKRYRDRLKVNPRPRILADSDPERFWAFVDKGDGSGCWTWTGGMFRNGRGSFHWCGKTVLAYQFSFFLSTGNWPDGKVLRHGCDNPLCVRPDHLTPGTTLENVTDRVQRGRGAYGNRNGVNTKPETVRRGARHPMAKLNPDQVREIIARYSPRVVTRDALAGEFGVSTNTIDRILAGRRLP